MGFDPTFVIPGCVPAGDSRSERRPGIHSPCGGYGFRIIAMLQAPAGTTIAAIMTATDWQQHSVRGFLAGVVRKKLGLNLAPEQTDKGRVYRIKGGKASSATVDRVNQTA